MTQRQSKFASRQTLLSTVYQHIWLAASTSMTQRLNVKSCCLCVQTLSAQQLKMMASQSNPPPQVQLGPRCMSSSGMLQTPRSSPLWPTEGLNGCLSPSGTHKLSPSGPWSALLAYCCCLPESAASIWRFGSQIRARAKMTFFGMKALPYKTTLQHDLWFQAIEQYTDVS